MKNHKALTPIILFVILFLGSPVITGFLTIALFLYVSLFKNGEFTPIINRVERINGSRLLIACGLTLASLAIYQSANYVTHLGFPSPFITYYNLPVTGEALPFWSKLAVDLFAAGLNVFLYYLLLSLIHWIYKRGTLWLGRSRHGSA